MEDRHMDVTSISMRRLLPNKPMGRIAKRMKRCMTGMKMGKARLETQTPIMTVIQAAMVLGAQDVEVDVVLVRDEALNLVTVVIHLAVLAPVMDRTTALDAEAGVHGRAVGPLKACGQALLTT
jgi:hypothetical protein